MLKAATILISPFSTNPASLARQTLWSILGVIQEAPDLTKS
jgi:hypothetical protein